MTETPNEKPIETDAPESEKSPAEHVNDLKVAGLALWDVLQDKLQTLVPPVLSNQAVDRVQELERKFAAVQDVLANVDSVRLSTNEDAMKLWVNVKDALVNG